MSATGSTRILGIGCDICRIDRIRRSVTHLKDDWIDHIFTSRERGLALSTPDPIAWFARGFCGKEAWFKTLGIGHAEGVGWKEIEILQGAQGAKVLIGQCAQARVAVTLASITQAMFHATTTSDGQFAYAVVVASGFDSFSRSSP